MLSDRCLSCPVLSVCNVRALWPKGWTDQDETWNVRKPRPWPHCIRWVPRSPSPKGARPPQFSAHICCGQMAAWIKIPLSMELGLDPGDFVLDGDLAPPPQIFDPCLLWPNGWMDQDGTWHGDRPQPRRLWVRWRPSPLPQKGAEPPPQFSALF